MNVKNIDWNALKFTCSKERPQNLDEQAERWFQRTKRLESQQNEANDAEMVDLYQRASERGHYKAMLHLAELYIRGTGVVVDEGKAVDLVEKAMKLESAHAYYLMGVMLQQRIGVKRNKTAALSYFRQSADMGNRYGQAAVGEDLLDAFQQEAEPIKGRGKSIGRQALECALSQDLADAGMPWEWTA